MATIPEYGTLGFNRGRQMNEPLLYGDMLGGVSVRPPERFGYDPVWEMRQSQLTAGAWGYAIGMVLVAAALAFFWL